MMQNMNPGFQEQIIQRLGSLYGQSGYFHYKINKFE